MRAVLALILVPPALAACGSRGGDTPWPDGSARVRVVQSLDPSGGLYVEGSRSFVRVEDRSGDAVVEQQLSDRRVRASTSFELPPGGYRLLSYQRPCDGSCDSLDAPTDECTAPLRVAKGRPLRVTIVLAPGNGCTARVSAE